jgi:hypothetical protein
VRPITPASISACLLLSLGLVSCKSHSSPTPRSAPGSTTIHPTHFQSPGTPLPRAGDEIVVAGQLFHTGAPVVLWTDPGGYDAYRSERRFAPYEKSSYDATIREIEQARREKKTPPSTIDSPNPLNLP